MTAPGPGYNHKRRLVAHPSGGDKRTKEADRKATDINRIMDRWTRTGMAPQRTEIPKYGDFSSGFTFHELLSRIRQAETDFNMLPANVRTFCDNDPGKFIDLVSTPDGRRDLEAIGLVGDAVPEDAPPASDPVTPDAPETPENPS